MLTLVSFSKLLKRSLSMTRNSFYFCSNILNGVLLLLGTIFFLFALCWSSKMSRTLTDFWTFLVALVHKLVGVTYHRQRSFQHFGYFAAVMSLNSPIRHLAKQKIAEHTNWCLANSFNNKLSIS